jgi:hypothetical protein
MRLLLAIALLGVGAQALAEDCVADLGGVLDGNVTPVPPSQIQIDGVCRIMNYPNGMSTNFSFLTQPGQTQERWIVIFDNVLHTGQMACNAVAGHKIWFVNGSSSTIQQNCQNLLIPVEKIDKANPAGPPFVTIGVPFTYRLTIPVLFDPATGQVINFQGSINDLHSITVWDNLNEPDVDLTYVSHTMTWEASGSARAAHVHERGRQPHLRQHSDRPVRGAVLHRHHGRARGYGEEHAEQVVHEPRDVGLRPAHRRYVL